MIITCLVSILAFNFHCAQIKAAHVNVNEYGQTPLMLAVHNQKTDLKRIIRNSDLNRQDILGMTALMYAAQDGNEKAAQQLIIAGSNLDTQDKKGWTALMHAAHRIRQNNEIIELLLQAKANPYITSKDGDTFATILHTRHPELLENQVIQKALKVSERQKKTEKKVTFCPTITEYRYEPIDVEDYPVASEEQAYGYTYSLPDSSEELGSA